MLYKSSLIGSGITPAWAGKSHSQVLGLRKVKDHPRVGGEKRMVNAYLAGMKGSPPRGRGKDDIENLNDFLIRITPAWAGKSIFGGTFHGLFEDHPRVGGEKFIRKIAFFSGKGSPPRGRGKDQALKYAVKGARITPAWAGKSVHGYRA